MLFRSKLLEKTVGSKNHIMLLAWQHHVNDDDDEDEAEWKEKVKQALVTPAVTVQCEAWCGDAHATFFFIFIFKNQKGWARTLLLLFFIYCVQCGA